MKLIWSRLTGWLKRVSIVETIILKVLGGLAHQLLPGVASKC